MIQWLSDHVVVFYVILFVAALLETIMINVYTTVPQRLPVVIQFIINLAVLAIVAIGLAAFLDATINIMLRTQA